MPRAAATSVGLDGGRSSARGQASDGIRSGEPVVCRAREGYQVVVEEDFVDSQLRLVQLNQLASVTLASELPLCGAADHDARLRGGRDARVSALQRS